MITTTRSYVIEKHTGGVIEFFSGLNVITGAPEWSSDIGQAQLWESRLHAESQALLLARNGDLGAMPVPILTAVLGEALRHEKD